MNDAMLSKADEIAKMLSCIAHPLRLLIICMLLKRAMFVNELTEELGTTKGNISQHLRVLVDRGLIGKRRDGNRVFYRIRDTNLADLIARIKKLYCPDFDIQ
jgi:DNA-binding transcriptional ArsR family regulator